MKMSWNVKIFYVTITYTKKEGTVKKDEAGRITERAIKALQRFWDGSVSHAGA
jgi:hypothetical protein